ncbi:MAG: HI0074 family nucleotidyltransferase substrate-binding subunit [Pseudomonadota bacterium]
MKDRVLKASAEALMQALARLKEALSSIDGEDCDELHERLYADAAIKNFEVAFEYAWKFMKAAAEHEGLEVYGPRPAIQEATRFGWIDDPEWWAEALDARNGSVHDYFGISMNAYMKIVRRFVTECEAMAERIEKKTTAANRKTRK